MKRFLEAGRLNSPRGIKGELKFSCWCDSPDYLEGVEYLYLDPKGEKRLKIVNYRPNIPSIVFEGYEDRTACAVLTGRTVYFDRYDPALPGDVIYNDDLIGLPVYDAETEENIGTLQRIDETIGGFLYYIAGGEKEYLMPAVDRYIVSVDLERGIRVHVDEGLRIGS
ncbi:MAG: 16S rRNA processing protein RimM [Clostridia bacterium]|nr:16S rRNA processing protein RimM [Clostridia bacterium]MBR6776962.1 16S rRNA processing protein RimM [Clostridia bacterium]